MELFLMRHGEAERPGGHAEDRLRPLTAHGHATQQRVAQALVSLIQPLDYLLSSPVLRARQTADIAAAAIPCTTPIEETSILADACTVGAVLNLLQEYPRDARILCVSHEPYMSRLSAVFLDGEGRSAIAFQPGSVLGITFHGHPSPGHGMLRFFFQPHDLVSLLDAE